MSFTAQHIKGGFKGSGLFPLSRSAIKPSKLAPSVAFIQPQAAPTTSQAASAVAATSQTASATAQSQCHGDKEVHVAGTTETMLPLTCCKCGGSMTPVRLHVVAYFSRHLEGMRPPPRGKKRVKPQFYGEALTSDEVFGRIEEAEQAKAKAIEEKKERQRIRAEKALQKKEKKESKKQKRGAETQEKLHVSCEGCDNEEPHDEEEVKEPQQHHQGEIAATSELDGLEDDECEVCGGSYSGDSEKRKKAWIGCDGCDRWFHYWCAGYKRKPSTRSQFLCYACKSSKP